MPETLTVEWSGVEDVFYLRKHLIEYIRKCYQCSSLGGEIMCYLFESLFIGIGEERTLFTSCPQNLLY